MSRVLISCCTALVMTGFMGGGAIWLRAQTRTTVRPAADVDLGRYAGRWYELARLPNRFQARCTGNVVVHYTTRPDGRLDMRNTCTSQEGAIETTGIARRRAGQAGASVLEVRFAPAILSFVPAVWGDYWILQVAPDYGTAVVGTPDRQMLWLLARTPDVDLPTYAGLIESARAQGFDVDRLVRTRHELR